MRRTIFKTRACFNLVTLFFLAGLPRAFSLPENTGDVVVPEIAQGWQSGPGAREPEVLSGAKRGVRLTARPKLDSRRCYWDKDVQLDLSSKEIIELEIFLFNPVHAEEISVHFRSGKGWYSASAKVVQNQAHVLQIDKHTFNTDGSPSGWDKIDRVRISIWRSGSESVSLYLYQINAATPRILVVGDGSEATAGALARNSVAHIEKWMLDIGLSARRVFSDQLTADILAGRDIVFLPYNPSLSSGAIGLLERYVAEGGRLFVFYSDKPQLARLMGFDIGGFTRSPTHYPWREIVFDHDSAPSFPAIVYQRVTAVIPVVPARSDAGVVATWKGAGPNQQRPPAILRSAAGFWMTQVPRKFHDLGKREMMAAAVSEMAPHLAPKLARHMLGDAGRVGGFQNVPEASLSLRRLARNSGAARAIIGELNDADRFYRQANTAISRREYGSVLRKAASIRRHLTNAYALSMSPGPRDEMRAVWDHYALGFYPGDWDRTARLLKNAGINAIFTNALNDGYAHYNSSILNHSQTFKDFGDQIEQASDAARRHGMEVHVWKVCWMLDGATSEFIGRMEREGRLQMRASGEVIPWLNPAHPENRRLAIESIREVAAKYDVDGIHLDYVRYSGSDVCIAPYSRREFERSIRRSVRNWPADVLPGGELHADFSRWKVAQINSFVAEAHAAVKEIDPDLKLSVAVFGGYPDCVRSVSQDWRQWLVDGTVDFLMPMNYTDSLDFFIELMVTQRALPGAAGRIYPGIGVTSSQSSLSPAEVLQQIEAVRARQMPGFILFDLDRELKQELLPILRLNMRL